MSEKPELSLRQPAVLLATWFGAGLIPRAPGTWGSAAALPFAWIFLAIGGKPLLLAAAIFVFLVGWWAASRYVTTFGVPDPGEVVIDEVAGQWLTLLAAGRDPWLFLAGFALFRLFDITKPWPVSWADSKVGGGLGVMLDDVLAGLYGLICLLLLRWI